MMNWYGDGMGGIAPLVWLLLILLWVALIALIVFLVVRLLPSAGDRRTNAPAHREVTETPEQTLDRLFALGEIDEATYRSRRTALAEMRRQQ